MIRWFAVLSRTSTTPQIPVAMFPTQDMATTWIAMQSDPADLYAEVIMWNRITPL